MFKNTIPFTRFRFIAAGISILLIVIGFAMTIVQGGFNLSVDFQSGLNLQVRINTASVEIQDVRNALESFPGARIQSLGLSGRDFTIQVKGQQNGAAFNETLPGKIERVLEERFGADSVTVLSENYVDSRFSSDLASQTFLLSIVAVILILAYVWFRFKFSYAVASILATLHDVAFIIAVIGAFQIEISTATVAAILTIIGYSLNDTIVVFDRIRENLEIMRDLSDEQVTNTSITTTLSRTIITSLTTVFAVAAIYIFTTGAVQNFAFNLIIGIAVGTYSSIFVAAPTQLAIQRFVVKRAKDRETRKFGVHAAPAVKHEAESVRTDAEPGSGKIAPKVPSSPKQSGSRTKKRKK